MSIARLGITGGNRIKPGSFVYEHVFPKCLYVKMVTRSHTLTMDDVCVFSSTSWYLRKTNNNLNWLQYRAPRLIGPWLNGHPLLIGHFSKFQTGTFNQICPDKRPIKQDGRLTEGCLSGERCDNVESHWKFAFPKWMKGPEGLKVSLQILKVTHSTYATLEQPKDL